MPGPAVIPGPNWARIPLQSCVSAPLIEPDSLLIFCCCSTLAEQTGESSRVNITLGPKEERLLMTGLHTVADIYCTCCNTVLGWKYVRF